MNLKFSWQSIFATFIILLVSFKVGAVSLSNSGKSLVFSEVHGVVLSHGVPVPNAKVIRKVEWATLETEETTTDEQGHFYFPPAYQGGISRLLPAEFVAAQSLEVEVQGETLKIWSNTKRSVAKNAELGGAALNLMCELTNPLALHREFGSILRTSCTW